MIWDWDYADGDRAWLVWIAAAVVIALGVLELRGRDAMASFLSPIMGRRLSTQASLGRSITRLALVFGCLALGVVALMRPQKPGESETTNVVRAADVMFVLDTSRSMLAEDASPNRLARAKAEISDLVARLEKDPGRIHRVGLVAFAGRATDVCALTPDHSFFNTILGTVDTTTAGRGGTRIGEAIKVAMRGFPQSRGAKVMVLITDGDDQDQYSEEAAKAARDAGIRIVAVGLGSETGAEIILTDPKTNAKAPLMYEGKPVISKLDRKSLEKIALTTEGAYIPAGTSAVDLDSIMESHITPIVNAAEEESTREIPAERFVWPILGSLGLLLAALWVGAGAGERRTP
ncbi:MAG TPA: VWA domain-containing protein [Kofleriaceae bacterium]|nr:VWA domain-containing protein [Kofleriaceae bacterium]